MNRILVLYDSQTGNVAKMARFVADGAESVPDTEVRLRLKRNISARHRPRRRIELLDGSQ